MRGGILGGSESNLRLYGSEKWGYLIGVLMTKESYYLGPYQGCAFHKPPSADLTP